MAIIRNIISGISVQRFVTEQTRLLISCVSQMLEFLRLTRSKWLLLFSGSHKNMPIACPCIYVLFFPIQISAKCWIEKIFKTLLCCICKYFCMALVQFVYKHMSQICVYYTLGRYVYRRYTNFNHLQPLTSCWERINLIHCVSIPESK